MTNYYVLYYGWLISNISGQANEIVSRIVAARPKILIACYYTKQPKHINLSREVCRALHAAGILVFAYVPTQYGLRNQRLVETEAAFYLDQGVDGIFFDEGYRFTDDVHVKYYQSLYNVVKQRDKSVILNTGIAQSNEKVMQVTDILMVEHQWRSLYHNNAWFSNYSADRFMGISSNEQNAHEILGYYVDVNRAIQDTQEAWSHNIAWHTSTNHYITVPPWLLEYRYQLD